MNKKEEEKFIFELSRTELSELMFFVSAISASADILGEILKPIYDSSKKKSESKDVENDG